MHFIFFSFGGGGGGGRLFEVGRLKSTFGGLGWWGGRLFEAGHLLNFSTFRKSSTKKKFSPMMCRSRLLRYFCKEKF